ncbi:hypothetical protein ACRBDH_02980 [Helicobacter pylori]
MRQNNETEKSFSKLKEITQAMREQKERSRANRGLKPIFNP